MDPVGLVTGQDKSVAMDPVGLVTGLVSNFVMCMNSQWVRTKLYEAFAIRAMAILLQHLQCNSASVRNNIKIVIHRRDRRAIAILLLGELRTLKRKLEMRSSCDYTAQSGA